MKGKNLVQFVILALAVILVLVGVIKIFSPEEALYNNSDTSVVDNLPSGQVAILDSNIIVSAPLSNQVVTSPVEIFGRARAFEGFVLFRVRDARNNIIATSSIEIGIGASEWGAYSKSLAYPPPPTPTGFVEIYTQGTRDGSVQDLIRLSVKFTDYRDPVMNLYFSNIIEDPELLNCDVVYSVKRAIPFSNNILGGVLGMLFSGLTEEEVEQGFVNNLPEDSVQILNMVLATSTLTLNFNQALQAGVSGACRTVAIRAQLTQTMLQFNGIDEVVILVDGEVDDILQP